jgi:chorismate dehydratase
VLLDKRYNVNAKLIRMTPGVNDYSCYDAVLFIGDAALKKYKSGLDGFENVFDLATEWYNWKKLPFVFAVWAVRKSTKDDIKKNLVDTLTESLRQSEEAFGNISLLHGKSIGLTRQEATEYLEGFNFHLGKREREAIEEFRQLVTALEPVL